MIKKLIASVLLLMSLTGAARAEVAENSVYKHTVSEKMDKVYPLVYETLENARFFVVFEPQISKNLQRFAEKWGKNHNKNQLTSIRSMVFCNAWYANAVSNLDPDMLALCPLRISLYEKQGRTTVLFARPTVIAAKSAAKPVLQELEDEIISAVKTAMNQVKK